MMHTDATFMQGRCAAPERPEALARWPIEHEPCAPRLLGSTDPGRSASQRWRALDMGSGVDMGHESILMVILIGGLAGWLAGLLLRGSGYGIIGDVVVGLIGAFVGNWLVRAVNVSLNLGSPIANRIVISVVGAVVLMLVVGLLRPRSLRERFTDVWRRR